MSVIKNEAQDAPTTFDFRGHSYTVPSNMNEADGDVLENFESDKPIAALRALLGEQQWLEYKRREKPKVKDHLELAEAAFKALGTSAGE